MPSHVCNDILNEILDYKKQELIQQKQQLPLAELKEKILLSPVPKNFLGAIEKAVQTNKQAIIAEIKKASPSKGLIRKDFDPIQIALTYEKAGATCLSILTDEKFFQGHSNDLIQVRKISNLPILRKDFIIDEYQIYQSRLIGADCILLIVAALTDQQLYRFTKLAQSLNLSVLVEVHDRAELDRALLLATPLIGINNRNLHTFTTTLQTTLNLIPMIPKDKLIISESGMHAREDIELLSSHGVHAFLIGETFMRADDPGKKLQELFG